MNERKAIWVVTGALVFGLSACLSESEQDDGGSIGGAGGGSTGFTGGSTGTGFTGGSTGTGFSDGGSNTGFIGGGVFFLLSTDGGIASDELEEPSDDTSSTGD